MSLRNAEEWEQYFRDGWEKNNGREQTRLFAEYFVRSVRLPGDARTLLDVGCAMGDATPVFHRSYPELKLLGCDVSPYAIEKARERYGEIARFELWSMHELEGRYDVIYCSNTLEHFEDYLDLAKRLLAHCRWLFVMVPYRELRQGKPLSPALGEYHVATFDRGSFKALLPEGYATRIRSWVLRTPGAWGAPRAPLHTRVLTWLLGAESPQDYRQIIFEIRSADWLFRVGDKAYPGDL